MEFVISKEAGQAIPKELYDVLGCSNKYYDMYERTDLRMNPILIEWVKNAYEKESDKHLYPDLPQHIINIPDDFTDILIKGISSSEVVFVVSNGKIQEFHEDWNWYVKWHEIAKKKRKDKCNGRLR